MTPISSGVMANRLLLTLLALLTGLAAQIAPSQARVGGPDTSAVAVSASETVRVQAVSTEFARLSEAGWHHVRFVSNVDDAFAAPQWIAPCVRLRIDRARE